MTSTWPPTRSIASDSPRGQERAGRDPSRRNRRLPEEFRRHGGDHSASSVGARAPPRPRSTSSSKRLAPELKDRIPVALRAAQDGETPDITSPVVVADPIATGYTMTQADLASALGLSAPDVSVFVRAFQLTEEEECAVTVRKGSKQPTVNYHPRAIDRVRALVASPPADLTEEQKKILSRVTRRLRPTAP